MRRARKVDANQKEIVEKLRQCHRRVEVTSDIGRGFPDLIVHWGGKCILMEVKMPGEELTPAQIEFHARWAGPPIAIVYCVRDALLATEIRV